MNFNSNLQIEFKHKKHCDKLEKFIHSDVKLSICFDCRLDNTIMFKFQDNVTRDNTMMLMRKGLRHSKIRSRASGIDYLYVPRL